jgi:site-specific recombinase XerD
MLALTPNFDGSSSATVGTTRVYQKGPSWYYVEDLEETNPKTGRPKQKWHRLCRVDEGEAALHKALAVFHGKAIELGNIPGFIKAFGQAHYPTLSFGVRKEYERMYGVISKAFTDFDVAEVQPGDILQFLNENFSGARTARGHYKARLSTFFSWCVLNQGNTGVKVNPCREVRLKKPPKRRGRMNAAVYWAMHDALPEVGQLFLELAYATRQRPHEIRVLREGALLADRIRFEPSKTEASSGEYVEVLRSARINRILERLRELRAQRLRARKVIPIGEQRNQHLFVNERGEPFTKSGLNSLWRRAREKAGHQKVTTLDIRPYALHEMEKAGHPIEKIREAAAHTSTDTTEGYLNQHRERFSTIVLEPPARP